MSLESYNNFGKDFNMNSSNVPTMKSNKIVNMSPLKKGKKIVVRLKYKKNNKLQKEKE